MFGGETSSTGAIVVRVAANAIVTAVVYSALSSDFNPTTAILIYVGQLLVTGFAIAVVLVALVGFAALDSRLLAAPVVVAAGAVLAGGVLYARGQGKRRGEVAREEIDSNRADIPYTPSKAPWKLQEEWAAIQQGKGSMEPGALQQERNTIPQRKGKLDILEEENGKLRTQVSALTRLLITKGVFSAEEIAEQLAAVRNEEEPGG